MHVVFISAANGSSIDPSIQTLASFQTLAELAWIYCNCIKSLLTWRMWSSLDSGNGGEPNLWPPRRKASSPPTTSPRQTAWRQKSECTQWNYLEHLGFHGFSEVSKRFAQWTLLYVYFLQMVFQGDNQKGCRETAAGACKQSRLLPRSRKWNI